MSLENNFRRGNLTMVWLTDARKDEVHECSAGVSVDLELAGIDGLQLHHDAVTDKPANGHDDYVGVYRTLEHE